MILYMPSDCLNEVRIKHIVFDAGLEALEGLSQDSNWKPGQYKEFVPQNNLEEILFDRVQKVAKRCYKAAMATRKSRGGKRFTRRA